MPEPQFQITPLDISADLAGVTSVWNASLPGYPLPASSLQKLIPKPTAHHLVARTSSHSPTTSEGKIIGFVLSYQSPTHHSGPSGYLAVLAVHPKHHNKGIGTALISDILTFYRAKYTPCNVILGSSFPRFWPGVPRDLPDGVVNFFAKRGFRFRDPGMRSVDLFRVIEGFGTEREANVSRYVERAREGGFTFGVLREDGFEECIEGQRRNFADNAAWVEMFETLDPNTHPSSIMVAYAPGGKQIGWTLMLSPSSPILQENWALPPLCGPDTGLIGCVGIDQDARGTGIGLALVSHAMEDMRNRGIRGVFVDWVAMEGYYEKLGFEVWRGYRVAGVS
ncbi:acyl-CoA N-acyltransferase [Aspergillus pseudodeflectus]|uniref:Acyl-CoA N-acyltransferase n=1 Tax=Aspergillus pseudodeflectus TaxID=176178 RepID=A0ABR4L7T0_9EURO